MSRLADIESSVAAALLAGDTRLAPPMLLGGHDPRSRFAVHIRNYQTSLRNALLEKFPATTWLLGTNAIARAAGAYVREHPPSAPCIAEYGSTFPAFIADFDGIENKPYVHSFAKLEWALGHAAIAVDEAAVDWQELAGVALEALLDTGVTLQPGVEYIRATHPVDTLIRLFLSETEPDSLELPAGETLIEVRGSRGAISMDRLDGAGFAFRNALAAGGTINDAATAALDADPGFDPGQALRKLIDQALVVSISLRNE
jgi:hypothetical protein